MAAIFQIPERYNPGFKLLASLKLEDVTKLAQVVNGLPVGSSEDQFTHAFSKIWPTKNAIDLAETIYSLGSFLTVQDNSAEKVANQLTEAYYEINEDQEPQRSTDDLEKKLLMIFSQESFKKTFKAIALLYDNEKNFRDSKIITDVRLIFNDDLSDKSRHAIIIHRLKIEYLNAQDNKEFYISLDSGDLQTLKRQIERAVLKETQIKENYKDAISFIDLT